MTEKSAFTEYPECEMLKAQGKEYQAIMEFIEWLSYRRIHVPEDLVYDFLGINRKRLEQERRQILEAQRKLNE